MNHHYIPEGFQTISPYFCVANADGFIDFLERAFHAQTLYVKKENSGRVDHALLQIGNAYVELAEANEYMPARSFSFQLFAENCDETFANAINAGAKPLMEPTDKPYGLRAGYVEDAWGNHWYISTQIKSRYKPAFWKVLQENY